MRPATVFVCLAALWLGSGCDRVCGTQHAEWYQEDAGLDADGPPPTRDGASTPIDADALPDAGCAAVGFYILMDSSESMADAGADSGQILSRKDSVLRAVRAVINDPAYAGLMVGVGFTPEVQTNTEELCDPGAYATPAVAIDRIPGANEMQSKAILGAIEDRDAAGRRTFTPALSGALRIAKTHNVSVLFLTDGRPGGGCPDDLVADAAAIARTYAADMPSTKTYVIGLGPGIPNLDAFDVDRDGGTKRVYLVGDSDPANIERAVRMILREECR